MLNVAGEDGLGELSDPARDFGSDSCPSSSSLDSVSDTSSGSGCSDSESHSHTVNRGTIPKGIEGCKCMQGIARQGLQGICCMRDCNNLPPLSRVRSDE